MSISERKPRSSGNSGCPEHVRNSLDATWSIAIDSGDSRRDITSFGGTPRGADQLLYKPGSTCPPSKKRSGTSRGI